MHTLTCIHKHIYPCAHTHTHLYIHTHTYTPTYRYSAFETIDRKFGFGLDTLQHHITDGHIVHHLFFRKIPHYNLPIATKVSGLSYQRYYRYHRYY